MHFAFSTSHKDTFLPVPGLTTAKGLSLALQANDPHTADFTLAILRLHENNFLETLKRKWWNAGNGCPEEQETGRGQSFLNPQIDEAYFPNKAL